MGVGIKAIEYYLPEKEVSNEDLQILHPQWDLKKVGRIALEGVDTPT